MTEHKLSCSFCGRSRAEVAHLVAGPGVSICNFCVEIARQSVYATRNNAIAEMPACSFCSETRMRGQHVAFVGRICNACIVLCEEILGEHAPAKPLPSAHLVKD